MGVALVRSECFKSSLLLFLMDYSPTTIVMIGLFDILKFLSNLPPSLDILEPYI